MFGRKADFQYRGGNNLLSVTIKRATDMVTRLAI